MLERLESIEKKYNQLNEELMQPETLSNIKRTLEITKEQASLKDAYDAYQQYKQLIEEIETAKEMCKDKELGEFAKEELATYQEQLDKLNS